MFETVDEIAAVLPSTDRRRLPARAASSPSRSTARRLARCASELRAGARAGLDEQDLRELSGRRARARVRVAGAPGATFSPHVARVHPAKLLPAWPERSSGSASRSTSDTPVSEIRPHDALTPAGRVRARWVVRATEGYTASLRGPAARARADEQLDDRHRAAARAGVGADRLERAARRSATRRTSTSTCSAPPTGASRSAARRALPLRLANGRRGATPRRTVAACARSSSRCSRPPRARARARLVGRARRAARLVRVGRRRPAAGLAWAGGYVGEGVAASNLAARILRDLILERPSALTTLALGRAPPAPLGARAAALGGHPGLYSLYRLADRGEQRTRSAARGWAAPGGRPPAAAREESSRVARCPIRRCSTSAASGRDDHAESTGAAQHDRAADARRARGAVASGGRRRAGQGDRAARRRAARSAPASTSATAFTTGTRRSRPTERGIRARTSSWRPPSARPGAEVHEPVALAEAGDRAGPRLVRRRRQRHGAVRRPRDRQRGRANRHPVLAHVGLLPDRHVAVPARADESEGVRAHGQAAVGPRGGRRRADQRGRAVRRARGRGRRRGPRSSQRSPPRSSAR